MAKLAPKVVQKPIAATETKQSAKPRTAKRSSDEFAGVPQPKKCGGFAPLKEKMVGVKK